MPIWNVNPDDLNPNPSPNPNLDDDALAGNAMIMIIKEQKCLKKVRGLVDNISDYVTNVYVIRSVFRVQYT